MITILCQNCGGAIEVNPDTSPKKKGECPHCKKLIFKRTGNVVEWSTKKKKLTGRQKLWYTIAACACFCVIFFGMIGVPAGSKSREIDSYYPEEDSRSKWIRGDIVTIVNSPVFGEEKKYLVDSGVLADEGKAEDFLHFAERMKIREHVHVFRVGDKARVIDVYPFSLRLLPFNDTKKSFWVYDSDRLKRVEK
ncbi:hypothetical protein [Akkermansia muciniphila]|uniref:hypothetical protein n=1 Tax=Akkermansia muciniphila TaxID=239935 RepID=UPI0011AFC8FC|nr:hypothetical protein [Akkermansia muciniphila]